MTDDPFVEHRRLLFTVAYEMLGSAVDAEDVLQESWLKWHGVDQSVGPRPAGLSGPDRHPDRARPVAHSAPTPGGLRRPVAARAAADHARCGRGRRARRQSVDGHAAGAGDVDPDRAGGVPAPRRLRPGLRRAGRRCRQDPGRRPADRLPGPGPRRRAATPRATPPRPRPGPRSTPSSEPSTPATCRV